MTLDEYLAHWNISLADVFDAIARKIGVADDDTLFVTGSLVEGLGNLRSDIDIYIVTNRDLSEFHTGPVIIVECSGRALDVESWTPNEVLGRIKLISNDASPDPRAAL